MFLFIYSQSKNLSFKKIENGLFWLEIIGHLCEKPPFPLTVSKIRPAVKLHHSYYISSVSQVLSMGGTQRRNCSIQSLLFPESNQLVTVDSHSNIPRMQKNGENDKLNLFFCAKNEEEKLFCPSRMFAGFVVYSTLQQEIKILSLFLCITSSLLTLANRYIL